MRAYLEAKAAADEALMKSSLAWTIVRPGSLQDDPGTGRVDVSTELGRRGPITRDDVAAVLQRMPRRARDRGAGVRGVRGRPGGRARAAGTGPRPELGRVERGLGLALEDAGLRRLRHAAGRAPADPAGAQHDDPADHEQEQHAAAGDREGRARREQGGDHAAEEEAEAGRSRGERLEEAGDARLEALLGRLLDRGDDGDPLDAVAEAADDGDGTRDERGWGRRPCRGSRWPSAPSRSG